jgi:hypothetical protein
VTARTRALLASFAIAAAAVGSLAGCSSSSDHATSASPPTTTVAAKATTTSTVKGAPRAVPHSAAASISGPLSGGKGIALAAANPGPALAASGYVEAEYRASGTASSYTSKGALPADGRFQLSPGAAARYATRIVVRRPKSNADFSGTVVVEWLNVSGGADAAPDYTYLSDEIVRSGDAWVGVSAQRIGIEGGPVAVAAPHADITGAGKGIKALDPARYSSLEHPGDAFSYDIFTQVAQAMRATADTKGPLGGADVKRVLAVGESQSAFALTTYADGVQPLTHEFDGFLIHSRGGAAAPLGKPDEGIDIAGTVGGTPTRIRTDLDVPVIMVETESDVVGLLHFLPARQPDTDRIRTWEVAGTAHADKFQIGAIEPDLGCSAPINRGQQSFVLKAALHDLDAWAGGGQAPPKAKPLAVSGRGDTAHLVLDADGNAKGGVRTPSVDAPVDRLTGLPVAGASIICVLMGSTSPLPSAELHALYPSRAAYSKAYGKAADDAIAAGFVLPADRKALIAESDPTRIP